MKVRILVVLLFAGFSLSAQEKKKVKRLNINILERMDLSQYVSGYCAPIASQKGGNLKGLLEDEKLKQYTDSVTMSCGSSCYYLWIKCSNKYDLKVIFVESYDKSHTIESLKNSNVLIARINVYKKSKYKLFYYKEGLYKPNGIWYTM
ncbi:MAG: hypothetical protein ACLGGV_08705 [Bacteroidia bacterium]